MGMRNAKDSTPKHRWNLQKADEKAWLPHPEATEEKGGKPVFLESPRSGVRQPSVRLDYRAKDYEAYRRWMLERMGTLVPQWRERHPADLGVTLLELLAGAADHLSYYQDAAAREAYLETARRRISVRRHARMLDYRLHEGCEAMVWLHVRCPNRENQEGASSPAEALCRGCRILPQNKLGPGIGEVILGTRRYRETLRDGSLVFYGLETVHVHTKPDELTLFTEGQDRVVLRQGATSATVHTRQLGDLEAGDLILLLASQHGETDVLASQVVRLCVDPRPLGNGASELRWFDEDALRRDLVAHSTVPAESTRRLRILGNILPAEQGKTALEVLPTVVQAGRYRPRLTADYVAHSPPYDETVARRLPASRATERRPELSLPNLRVLTFEVPERRLGKRLQRWLKGLVDDGYLTITEESQIAIDPRMEDFTSRVAEPRSWRQALDQAGLPSVAVSVWSCRPDLMNSGPLDPHVVLETEEAEDRLQYRLRFGDGRMGRRPPPGAWVLVIYFVGAGEAGNIGHGPPPPVTGERDSVYQAFTPLPGWGGRPRQSTEQARLEAPFAFREQQRCVTEEDFVNCLRRHPEVEGAAAVRGTDGHMDLYLRRRLGLAVDGPFQRRIHAWLAPRRLLGSSIEVHPPVYVPVETQVEVTLTTEHDADQFRYLLEHPIAGLEGRLASLLAGTHYRFGEHVVRSDIIAAVAAQPGVLAARVVKLRRRTPDGRNPVGAQAGTESEDLVMASWEIAVLADERGQFVLEIQEDTA